MNRTGIRPNTDTDYWRWKCTIEDMKKDLANLLTRARDAYIALRKLELMADSGSRTSVKNDFRRRAHRGTGWSENL